MPAMASLPLGRVHRREQDQNIPPWKSTVKVTAKNLSTACVSVCATRNQNIPQWNSTRKVTAKSLSPACATENQNIPPWKRTRNVTAKSLSPVCAAANQNIPPWKSTTKVTAKSQSPSCPTANQNRAPWKSTRKVTAKSLSPACATGNQNLPPWKGTRKVTAKSLSPACATGNQNLPPWKGTRKVTAKSLSPACASVCATRNQNLPPWRSTRKVAANPKSLSPACISVCSTQNQNRPRWNTTGRVTAKSLSPACASVCATRNQNLPPWRSTRKVAANPKSLSPACISVCATRNQNRPRWNTTGRVTAKNISPTCVSICATSDPSPNSRRKRTPLGQSNFLQDENISAQKQSSFAVAPAETDRRRAYQDELRELSSLQPVSSICASFLHEKSPAVSKPPDEMCNIKVSSLIQMWREIEAGAGLAPRSALHKNINLSSISSQTQRDGSHNSFLMKQGSEESVAFNMADEEQADWESETAINPREPSLPPSSISCEWGSDEGDEFEPRERFESESLFVHDAEMQINGRGMEIGAAEDSFLQNEMEQVDRYVSSQLSQSNPHQKTIKPIEDVDDMEDDVVSDFKQNTIKPNGEVVCTSFSPQQQQQTTRRQLTFDDIWLERHSDDKELLTLLDRRTVSKALTGDFGQKIDRILSSFLEKQRQESVEYESAQDHFSEGDQDLEAGSVDSFASTPTKLPPTHGCHQCEEGNQEERQIYGHMHSNEMELIYEMKKVIVRLVEEICELKKSIESCVELQMKMQHFAKPEDFPVSKYSEIKPLQKLQDVRKLSSRGSCCIC